MVTYFMEHVTLRTWIRVILPTLLRRRWREGSGGGRGYVFDGSRPGLAVARATRWLTGVSLEPFHFRLGEMRDERGCSMTLTILYKDLLEVLREAMEETEFREVISRAASDQPRLAGYLAKALAGAATDLSERHTLWRVLMTIRLCAWKMRRLGAAGCATYFLERRPWMAVIARFAARQGIAVVPMPLTLGLWTRMRRHLPAGLVDWLRDLQAPRPASPRGEMTRAGAPPARARLAVEYFGHLNLRNPALHSNLFFWQQSSLPAEAILVAFGHPLDPLDRKKWEELTTCGMGAIALHPRATAAPALPLFVPGRRRDASAAPRRRSGLGPDGLEAAWLREHLGSYARLRAWWAELFESQSVKVYVSWFKTTETHCAIADAMQGLGGVTAIYQRSYESFPSAQMAVHADVVFGFSPEAAEVERSSGSIIPYYVITGYLGDHRPPLLQAQAQAIRERLTRGGATRVLAYCDENSNDEARWAVGHALTREAYAFLLERLLAAPWLGLVIKPKTPRTLRRRLGPVAQLLTRAEATGRCVVLESGQVQGSFPPAAAALAADVLVHGHLWAATAGVESALAGVPTLIMDREGWPVSPFYRLGAGRVVFTEWEALWDACLEHWRLPGGIPGFGDWSPMLDELDPFRDGRAAERMGTYLQWLLEGFDAGLDRAAVMADAAERYAARWGRGNVMAINTDSPPPAPARQPLRETVPAG